LGLAPVAAMLRLAPARLPAAPGREGVFPARQVGPARLAQPRPVQARDASPRHGRVALLRGCVAPVIAPEIAQAALRPLNRAAMEVVATQAGCCGWLSHHMGGREDALAAARRHVAAWTAELEGQGLDAILVTASGCGTTVKDYGFMLRTDLAYAVKAAR